MFTFMGGGGGPRTAIVTGWTQQAQVSDQLCYSVSQHFKILHYGQYDFGDTEDQDWLATLNPHFLFNFGPLLIRPVLLDACKEGAINFHPAPPEYPGRGGATYAIYNRDEWYGITAHLMEPEIDSGPILAVYPIPIQPGIRPDQLHGIAIRYVPVFAEEILALAAEDRLAPTTQHEWSRRPYTQADLDEFMRMSPTLPEPEMRRRIEALRHPEKPGPYLQFRGIKFWYIEGMS